MLLVSIPYDIESGIKAESKSSGKKSRQLVIDALRGRFARSNSDEAAQKAVADFFRLADKLHLKSDGKTWTREDIHERS